MSVTHSLDLESTSSQYATAVDHANFKPTGAFTVEAWIKRESVGAAHCVFASWNYSASKFAGIIFNFESTNKLRLVSAANTGTTGGGTNYDQVLSTTIVADTQWHHVAGVWDTSNLLVYIDGELVGTEAYTTAPAYQATNYVRVGALTDDTGGTSTYFDGLLRNVRFWGTARTQAQIRTDMNVDSPSVATSLVSNWLLNNAYTDSSGNSHTLTGVNTPTFSTTYPDALDLTENGTYLKKHKITIDNTKVSGSSDLTDIPIVLTESNFLADAFSNSLNGGADIRFSTDEDGTIRLAHEIVTWNTGTSVAEVHVKVNTLSYNTDTDIYVHYNNSSATALDENEAFGKHQVWGTNWKGVWHLEGVPDSTINSHDFTAVNTPSYATGKIGNALDLGASNTNKYLTVSDNLDVDGGILLLGGWFKLKTEIGSGTYTLINQSSNTTRTSNYINYEYNGGTRRLVFNRDRNGAGATSLTYNITLGTSDWTHILYVYDGTNIEGFVNGASVGTQAASGNGTDAATPNRTTIGIFAYNLISHPASILADNCIARNTIQTDDYIATLYNNQNSPSTFATPKSLSSGNFFMFL